MLEVQDLTVRFSGLTALSGLTFEAGPGMVFAIIGPNGSGKTTLFNAITGVVQPASGSIRFEGHSIAGLPPHRIAAKGICRTFQNSGLFRDLTVLENVLTGLVLSTPSTLAGTVLGLADARQAEATAVERARAMLAENGIADLADRPVAGLPFGQQRLVEISRAMVAGARLLMLDEPAVGLSPGERMLLGEHLRGLAGDGLCVLLVEHQQELVMAVSDRVLVLDHGKRIAEGPPDAIRRDSAVLEAYLGYE